jgi:hypothetical protein
MRQQPDFKAQSPQPRVQTLTGQPAFCFPPIRFSAFSGDKVVASVTKGFPVVVRQGGTLGVANEDFLKNLFESCSLCAKSPQNAGVQSE